MANPPRAARHWATVAILEGYPGSKLEDFAFVDALGAPFKWVVDDTSTADDFTVLDASGGTSGQWVRQRVSITGDDLTDADATIHVGGKFLRQLPAATLGANRTLTLGTTNAATDDVLRVVRYDVGAYTYQIDNGGAGGGTLCTMPVGTAYWAEFRFDGTDWVLIGGGALPT